ncbi:Hypothetical protein GLP15_1496 [Giardia lamblia P15]|uniref:Phospholipid/glycerol acyltransferase domain-containing protein n=1 Tax=Giardia intestinalis (strain P15) TaxID=658858 RepID=E1EYP4_GIAIA|nr:Hypothetical protein GLP15_1496 [Giardia lamblia P15]
MASFISPDLNRSETSVDGEIEYRPVLPFIQNKRYTSIGEKWYVKYLLLPCYLPLSPFVLLLRILITIPLFLLLALACFLLNLGTDPARPFDRVRATLLILIAAPIIRLILFTMGYCVIVRNRKGKAKCHAIVANHTDFMDIPCMYCAESTSYVSKEAATRFWAIRAIATATRTILIRRDTAKRSHEEVPQLISPNCDTKSLSGFCQLEARAKIMKEEDNDLWTPLLIFPEGTTTTGKGLLRFHTSIFRLGASVQPISIKYYSWIHTEYVGKSLLRVLMRKLFNPFCITVITYLETVASSDELSPRTLADIAGKRIADSLHIPYLPYTSEDGFYFRNLRTTPEKCSPEFIKDYGWIGTEDALNLRQDVAFTEQYRLPKGPIIRHPGC